MKRYFYVSDSLNDIEKVERALEQAGVSRGQIHVLSNDEAGVQDRDLNQVYSWFKTDVLSTTYKGVLIGLGLAVIVLISAQASGVTATLGWAPFIMLAIVCFGFCTWEAGLIGSHLPSTRFKRFQKMLEQGQHVIMVDAEPSDMETLDRVVSGADGIYAAGEEATSDQWTVITEKKFRQFANWGP
jgi:hypothetical protein